jgi:tRNA(Ile)-lysidine synthase
VDTAEFVKHFEGTFQDLVGSSVLIALSGGGDSVALLRLLREPALGLDLAAAHVHHGLRGVEADADAAFCRDLCAELGVPIAVLDLPTDRRRPVGGEAGWRRRRYRALAEHAAAIGVAATATAHHRDDVAEGVVVQLLRGAGPRAMAGIAERTADGVIRPLLPWTRGELRSWLERNAIGWRDDSSNTDTSRLRNRVRLDFLPRLEVDFPGLRGHLVNLAQAIAEGEAFMTAEAADRVGFADPWDPAGGVPLAALGRLPRALRARWLHRQMALLGIDHTTRRQLELFHLMLDTGAPRAVSMGGRWRLRAAARRLWAEPPGDPAGAAATLVEGRPVGLGIPGWSVRLGDPDEPAPGAVWRWRPRSEASVIILRPIGAEDGLTDPSGVVHGLRGAVAGALPRHLRAAWPLFCEDDMIRWIPGVWQHPDPGESSSRVVEVIRR